MGKAWRSYCRGCLFIFACALAASGAVLAFFATLRYDGILMDRMFEADCMIHQWRIDSHFGNPPSHYRAVFSVSFELVLHSRAGNTLGCISHLPSQNPSTGSRKKGIAAVGTYHVIDRGRLLKDSRAEVERHPINSSSPCLVPEDDLVFFDDSEGVQGFRMVLLNTTFVTRAGLIRDFAGLVTGAILTLVFSSVFCLVVVNLRKEEKRYCCDDYFIGRREISSQGLREQRRQRVKVTWDDPLGSSWRMLVDSGDEDDKQFRNEISDLSIQ